MDHSKILYLSQADIKNLDITLQKVIEIVEDTFIEHGHQAVDLPNRSTIHPGGTKFFKAMPAMVRRRESVGVKWVSYFPGNREHQLPDSSCVIILNDIQTGLPVCIMEGLYLTYLRTAASATVAAKRMTIHSPQVIGVVGAGELARWAVRALALVFPAINRVVVASRTQKSRDLFCEEMSAYLPQIKFVASEQLESLVRESDIVLSATPQPAEPFLSSDWLREGALGLPLDMVAAWKPDVYQLANWIITDDANFLYDLLANKYGKLEITSPIIEIGKVMTEKLSLKGNERVFAFMNGVGSIDVTLGKYVFDLALEKGAGTQLTLY